MLKNLDGLVGVITGAGTGIGAAVARDLGSAHMRLLLVGRRPEPLAKVVEDVRAAGGEAVAFSGDVRKFEDMEKAVNTAIDRWGRLDVLVPDAAIADYGPIAKAEPGLLRDVIETNLIGVILTIRAALPHMESRKAGHIVVVSSASGRVTYVGEPAYVASKHGIVAFTECLRQEVLPLGIRVSTIEPGLVETPLIHVYPESNDLVQGVVALDPEDIARAVRYVLEQPDNVNVFEVLLRPTGQLL